jgi:hypothetical protein
MQISKAIVGAGVNLSVCRSDIFNHRCKLQSLKIASPFLASAARAYQHIPTYKRTYVERKKWQTALQGEKKQDIINPARVTCAMRAREERHSRSSRLLLIAYLCR